MGLKAKVDRIEGGNAMKGGLFRLTKRWLLGLVILAGAVGTLGQDQPLPAEARESARGAVAQLSVAIRGAVLAWPAAADLGELRLWAARIANVLVGRQSPEYQPGAGELPGSDGVGVIVYLERLRKIIESRARADERLRPLLFALDGVRFNVDQALERLREASRIRDLRPARLALRRALAFLIAARGSSEDPLSEGGARALYRELQQP